MGYVILVQHRDYKVPGEMKKLDHSRVTAEKRVPSGKSRPGDGSHNIAATGVAGTTRSSRVV